MTQAPSARSAQVAAVFDRVATTYENVGIAWFAPIAQGLVAQFAPQPGDRVVDVGCGRGAVLFEVADAVGPTGRVTGIDLSPRMVELTRAEIDRRGLVNADVFVADATSPMAAIGDTATGDDGPTFDAVTASLVLFFIPEPLAALAAWARLVRPGGRVAISTFGAQDATWRALDAVLTPYLPQRMLDARTSGASGPFSSDEGVAALFEQAGLVDIVTTHLDVSVSFDGVAEWIRWSQSHGQRAMWEHVPDDRLAEVTAAAAQVLQGCADAQGRSVLTQQVRYTVGSC